MSERKQTSTFFLFSGYLLSVLLVLVYVNMYPLWKLLGNILDKKILYLMPVAGTGLILVFVLLLFRYRQKTGTASGHGLSVIAGVVLCGFALALPDPGLPIKRIHVAEYMILSLVVRFAMSYRLQDRHLLFFSACFTALLGVHDEFLQGLHPARTYGLRDMCVNGLGSFGGALIWHGFGLFRRTILPETRHATSNNTASFFYMIWLLAGVIALAWPLTFYRTATLPYWPGMPLLGAIVFFSMYRNDFNRAWQHGVLAISIVSFSLILYPVVTNVSSILFY